MEKVLGAKRSQAIKESCEAEKLNKKLDKENKATQYSGHQENSIL